MTPFVAEILGTMLLILLGTGVVANVLLKDTKGNDSGLVVITLAWGFAVFAGVIVAGPYSGAHLNPAVSVGLAVTGLFPWEDVPLYILGQLIGASVGAVLAWLAYRDHYDRTEDPGAILATFSTLNNKQKLDSVLYYRVYNIPVYGRYCYGNSHDWPGG